MLHALARHQNGENYSGYEGSHRELAEKLAHLSLQAINHLGETSDDI